jgi:hypothetical protein
MFQYSFFMWSNHGPIKYPRILDLTGDVAPRHAALKIADIFVDVVHRWD